jgi:hypothetical protein
MPFRVSRAPSAGTSTVHIPYGRPGIELGWVWTNNGSPISYQVSTIRSFSVSKYSVQKSRALPDLVNQRAGEAEDSDAVQICGLSVVRVFSTTGWVN